ncbi:sodium-coupled monocarboxylate transporter 1 [Tribolium castaneum]|uniref:Sodium-dependent multivitamin transporter-like Protein n=1 Tax=Tribolium castaneum TaxID=7070 RepID=D6WH77_TRICA|nr:PREDICTED: sodium-coupled monocarboxylate transporter 1 [Tribolium castaneum]EFA00982.1 Putative sodium-dependent multivitamin transporter-like Protein [Tribolium castaneum]|eukprot:XP_008191415.1 PREDICTED: sodium-coupled monocarboxylate transporter 1 [Tribolium castaneum]
MAGLTTLLPDVAKIVPKVSFSWYDYILFCVMLGLSALIGVYFGCFGSKQRSADEYLMGNKKMKVFPISVSLVASHVSGITLLAVPADIYRYGASYWLLIIAAIFVTFTTIYVYLPVFYKLQITSTYEYLERRFDNRNRMFASFLFALGLFLYLPIVIYIPALALSAATGINIHLITPVVCGVCIFYTTLGGLKAVVWTDTLQFTITTGAVIAIFVIGVRAGGGFGAIWSKALEGHRLDIFDFDPDPTKRDSFWITSIGMSIGWLSMVGIHQSCVQKFLSVSTFQESKQCVIYFSIGISIVSSFSVFTGLMMYARYANCDPFTTGTVQKNDQLLPYYVMDVASYVPGLSGLFIAGIFCAALSTLSACLNCLAGTMYEDFISKIIGHVEEKTTTYILKLLVVITGVVCTVLVFVIEHLGGILALAISLAGVTSGPLLGMFTLGVLFPKASSKGSLYGAIIALLFASWIVTMAQYYKAQGSIVDVPKPTSVDGCLANFTTLSPLTTLNSTLSSLESVATEDITIENSTISQLLSNFTQATENGEKPKPFFLFRISHYYYTGVGALVTIICGLLISYVLENDDPPVHRDLISPVVHFALPNDDDMQKEKNKDYYSVEKALHLVTTNWEKNEDDAKIIKS